MKKVSKKDNSIKDSISKLFILRDSYQGTCMTQKDNPNLIWFEGATVLLQQGVDTLKSAKQILDSGDKDANKLFRSKVKETVSKLMVLQRSAVVTRSDDLAEHATFYNSASQNDIAVAPDRIDFGKWTDVREFYFGAYDYLVRSGTTGDWNNRNYNAYQSERDAFFGHDAYSQETWEYFAYYPIYWLEKTGHPVGTPKSQSHQLPSCSTPFPNFEPT